jgi:hypothetical protein
MDDAVLVDRDLFLKALVMMTNDLNMKSSASYPLDSEMEEKKRVKIK